MKLILKNNKVAYFLVLLNIASSFIALILSNKQYFPDADHYLSMAKSFNFGRYSSWYFLDEYYPETLRTPLYPLFLNLLLKFSDSLFFIKAAQYVLYLFSLYFVSKTLFHLSNKNIITLNIFLILTSINIQIPFYTGFISAETFSIFFTSLFIYLLVLFPLNYNIALIIGVVSAANVLSRPAFILFPILIAIIFILFDRSKLKMVVLFVATYILLLIPFGYWNYINHGKFKVTSLEGGAGLAHMSVWGYKLPKGYQDKNYWIGNIMNVHDATNPFHFTDEEYEKNRLDYEEEWEEINKELDKTLSKKDKFYHELMISKKDSVSFSPLHSSGYTILREKLLWKYTLINIKKDPVFYLKTRLYNMCRFYFTGINLKDFSYRNSAPILGKFNLYYPFLVSFVFIFLGLILSIIFILKRRLFNNINVLLILLLCFYQGFIHIAFSVQARYTVPVHLLILLLLSIYLSYKIEKKDLNEG